MRWLYVTSATAVVGVSLWGVMYVTRPMPESRADVETKLPRDPPDWHAALQKNQAETRWVQGNQRELRDDLLAMRAELEALRAKAAGSATSETPSADSVGEESPKRARSEEALAAWMDDELLRHAHEGMTHGAREELRKLTEADPNLEITNTSCSERFCRASITASNGELPSVASLLGNPKLASAGFMLSAGKGVMEVYFTPPGSSFENLREEAFAQVGAVR